MGLLERFKKNKEKEIDAAAPKVVAPQKKEEQKTVAKKTTKSVAKKEEAPEKKETKGKVVRAETARVIVSPLITEKAAQLSVVHTYVFQVERTATRTQVAVAFKELYGIAPVRVNIMNMRAEPVRFGRTWGRQNAWKKAIVTIPKGKTIQIYEGV